MPFQPPTISCSSISRARARTFASCTLKDLAVAPENTTPIADATSLVQGRPAVSTDERNAPDEDVVAQWQAHLAALLSMKTLCLHSGGPRASRSSACSLRLWTPSSHT